MDLINLLGAVWPEGNFWASLIKFFDVGNYAWTIILFTLVLKLVLSPLDFLQRYYTNKTTRMQAKLQPEMEKLKKRYGQNQTLLYQKQNELYQKNNVSMKGSCIVMLVYMVVTLTVFLTFYSSLQTISGANIKNQYEQLESTYTNSYEVNYYNYLGVDLQEFNDLQTKEEKNNYILEKENAKVQTIKTDNSLETDDEALAIFNDQKAVIIENAQIDVANKYIEIKDSWLWIKNVWRADNATISEIPTYEDYKALTGETSVSKTQYNLVMGKLLNNYKETNQINGYYILSIIVVVVSFLSQWLTKKMSAPKTKDGVVVQQQPGMTKVLMFLMPVMMLMFTLNSSAIFAMYIIVNSLASTLLIPVTTVLSNKIADRVEAKNEKKRKEALKVDYRR